MTPEEILSPSRMRFDDCGTIRDVATECHGLTGLPCWLIRDDVAAGWLSTVLDQLTSRVFDNRAL